MEAKLLVTYILCLISYNGFTLKLDDGVELAISFRFAKLC